MTEEVAFDQSKKGMSVASLVLGILGLVISWTYAGPVCAIIALILGIVSKNKKQGNPSFCKAGIILGVIGIAIFVILLILYLSGVFALSRLASS